MRLKILKKLRTASLNSEFTGSYKSVSNVVNVVDLFLRSTNSNSMLLFVLDTMHYFGYFQFMSVF